MCLGLRSNDSHLSTGAIGVWFWIRVPQAIEGERRQERDLLAGRVRK